MMRNRKRVLFFSTVPSELRDLLESAGFQPVQIKEKALDRSASEAVALILRFKELNQLIAEYRRTHETAWRHGLLLLIVQETTDSAALSRAWQIIPLKELTQHPGMPIIVEFPKWSRVALHVAMFAAKIGPAHNPELIVEPNNIPSEHRFFLRRSFGKFRRIRVLPLVEGASGASVYRITAFQAEGEEHPIPFLAKLGDTLDLELEHVKFRNEVRDFVPFNLRPNIITPLSCYGSKTSILVEDFVERAVPFQDALRAGDPALLITSLFQGTLRGWRRASKSQVFSAVTVFRTKRGARKEIVRNDKRFTEACNAASRYFKKTYSPDDLISRFEQLRVESAETCTVHGDLHARNIFVAAGSAACLIIDYANTSNGPACLDPACLEVDLLLYASRPQPGRFLRRAYSWPLKPLRTEDRQHCEPWVWEAIRALRIEAEVGMDPRAYVLALIGYLLRFARLPVKYKHSASSPRRKRAVAVCIAEWLICQLLDEKENKAKTSEILSTHTPGSKRGRRSRTARARR